MILEGATEHAPFVLLRWEVPSSACHSTVLAETTAKP